MFDDISESIQGVVQGKEAAAAEGEGQPAADSRAASSSSASRPGRIGDSRLGRLRQTVVQSKTSTYCTKMSELLGQPPTHLLLDCGIYHVSSVDVDAFRQAFVADFKMECLPPISEQRTVVFPFYADHDLKVPIAKLTPECIRKIAIVMNSQVKRFFPSDHPPISCVVCDKSGDATPLPAAAATSLGIPPTLYKHGLHFHWPGVFVRVDDALCMRLSLIAALERVDWSEHLGASSVDWDDIFDESVYGSTFTPKGLRMVGAPKASKCSVCRNTSNRNQCNNCSGNGHIYDPSFYRMFEAYKDANVDEENTRILKNNFSTLLKWTTVRSRDPDRSTTSEGWKPYEGCPMPSSDERNRKRKKKPDIQNMDKKLKTNQEVNDPDKEAVFRGYLAKFSHHYASSSMRIMYDGKHTYLVALRGDGSRFCLNLKAGFHKNNNVYMIVEPVDAGRNKYEARMRCFCMCKTTDGRYASQCAKFKSRKKIEPTPEEVYILYGRGTTAEYRFKESLDDLERMEARMGLGPSSGKKPWS